MTYPSVYDIPPCNRTPDMKEDLKGILKAQLWLCETEGIDPHEEPYIIELRTIIKELEQEDEKL
jgi:hypothetical protein